MISLSLAKSIRHDLPMEQVIDIPQQDRWQICYRLRDLKIDCDCPEDGSLRVLANCARDVLLIYSAVRPFIAPRRELLDWLERCWDSDSDGYRETSA